MISSTLLFGFALFAGVVGVPLFTAHGTVVLVAGAFSLFSTPGPVEEKSKSGAAIAGCREFVDENGTIMCFVPAGKVEVCRGEGKDKECEFVKTTDIRFDQTETTVTQFAEYVDSGKCPAEGFLTTKSSQYCNFGAPGRERHPMNCVQFTAAKGYCRFAGKRLPTRAEWVRAARGDDKRRYPWGDARPDCTRTVYHNEEGRGCGKGFTRPSGSFPSGGSPYGILDMSGSVIEWTSTLVSSCAGQQPTEEELDADGDAMRYVVGGSFADGVQTLAIDFETLDEQSAQHVGMGIRCVMDGADQTPR